MHWYFYVSYFFGGTFLVNAVPHFVNGVSGRSFPSPFASPPGKGLSSPTVNVLWGTFNMAIGYLLVCRVGEFQLRRVPDVAALAVGGLLMALMLARAFGTRLWRPGGGSGTPWWPFDYICFITFVAGRMWNAGAFYVQ